MRASTVMALLLVSSLPMAAACMPEQHPDPEWMKQPKAYQPKTADLTFNEERLKAYNMMSASDQEAFVEQLKAQKGAFKGMAVFQSGAGLGESMENVKYGPYELSASTEEIFLEIPIDYTIFTTQEVGQPLAPHRAIEFTGTLVDLRFQNQDKPRKLTLLVQADEVKHIER